MRKRNVFHKIKKLVLATAIAAGLAFAGYEAFEGAEISAYAESYGDFDYYTDYTYDGVYISSYNGTSGTVTIPSTINGKKVTSIGTSAFYWNKTVTKVVLPNTIKKISNGAFNGCPNLTSVNIPASVEVIGNQVFAGSTKCVVTVDSANKNFCIAGGAIFNKDKTVFVTATEKIAADYTVPSSVKTIAEYAFADNCKLTSITIPASVTRIDTGALSFTLKLNKITVASGNTKYYADGTALYDKGKTTVIASALAKTGKYTIPSTVKTIGLGAFEFSKLTSVVIPNGVKAIEPAAFGWSELTSVSIPASVTYIGSRAFDSSKIQSCSIGATNVEIGYSAFGYTPWIKSLTEKRNDKLAIHNGILLAASNASGVITIPYNVKYIADGAFKYNKDVTKIYVPNTVTRIGEDAFYSCAELTELYISSNVTSIGGYALADLGKLTKLVFKGTKLTMDTMDEKLTYTGDEYNVYAPSSYVSTLQSLLPYTTVKANSAVTLNSTNTVISNVKTLSYSGYECLQPSLTVKYNGTALKQGVDYVVYYKNNVNQGTATLYVEGIGKYQGVAGSKDFKITQTAISSCTISGIVAKTYTGNQITQSIVIKDGTKTLEKGTHYTVAYQDNVKVGTAKIIITGKGKYSGTVTKTFTIKPVQVSSLKISGIVDKTYTGNNIYQSIVVKRGSKTLTKGTHYTVSYYNNKQIGQASVTITGKGVYAGSVRKTFLIRPKKVTNLKASSVEKTTAKISWSKNSKASGYIVMKYNASKKTYVAVKTITGASTTSYSLKNLSKGTTYKYKVVAYTNTSDGKVKSEGVTVSFTTKK